MGITTTSVTSTTKGMDEMLIEFLLDKTFDYFSSYHCPSHMGVGAGLQHPGALNTPRFVIY